MADPPEIRMIVPKYGKPLSSEFLNFILALTNCQVVVIEFLELVAVAVLTKLLATEEKTAERVAMMVVAVENAARRPDLVENS
jgi:hypothetical protein